MDRAVATATTGVRLLLTESEFYISARGSARRSDDFAVERSLSLLCFFCSFLI